jgi:signal transduction histidine kinase
MMLSTLRMRLLASYLAVLGVALGVLAVALVVLLNTRSAPPQPTYQRLAAQLISLDLRTLLARPGRLRPALWLNDLRDDLDALAQARGIRLLIVGLPENVVSYDSAGVFSPGTPLAATVEPPNITARILEGVSLRIEGIVGSFIDNGEWLFVGMEALQAGGRRATALIVAEPRPVLSLYDALNEFGASVAPPVIQAALAGVIAAVLLAAWISRGIARPLQTFSDAALVVASGRSGARVPISGASEVRAVAEAFNRMSEQVETQQSAQQDFLANVSHDLKTPLTSIQGYAQAIIDGATPDPVAAAQIIYDESARLNRMVTELTDLTRLQAGRLSMQVSPVDLGALTAAVAQRLMIVARDKGVDLRVESPPMPPISGDGDRLAQVLMNLISNAIKYTPPGGMVCVRTETRGDGVAVVVEDSGIGIAADELPRIFERFYQVDKARGPKRGTGLGLAIVREIVAAHGGMVTADSEGANRGSVFTVWFPSPQRTTAVRRR